jgi:hypothetical protein
MTAESQNIVSSMIEYPLVARIRRNHGLEHATLHLLSQRKPGQHFAGHSDGRGFWVLGDVSAEEVQAAAQEALRRIRSGERTLVLHPNCGTNFVTSGILASLAALAAMIGVGRRVQDKLERLPLAAVLATAALILSQPLGMMLQERVTTSTQLENLEIVKIVPGRRSGIKAHRVLTRSP